MLLHLVAAVYFCFSGISKKKNFLMTTNITSNASSKELKSKSRWCGNLIYNTLTLVLFIIGLLEAFEVEGRSSADHA